MAVLVQSMYSNFNNHNNSLKKKVCVRYIIAEETSFTVRFHTQRLFLFEN